MTQQSQGVFRSLAQVSSRVLIFVVLAAPAAFSQQRKASQPPPQNLQSAAVTETNERIAELAIASSAKQGDYIIGAGDLLGIEVFDVPELSREVRVNETGYISLPLIPSRKVKVVGLTTFQLQDKIAELLQANGLVSTPQVTVSLKEQHSQPVTLIGAVRSPMVIQVGRQMTLIQALSQAGGIAGDAGNVVLVTRTGLSSLESKNADPTADSGTIENGNRSFSVTPSSFSSADSGNANPIADAGTVENGTRSFSVTRSSFPSPESENAAPRPAAGTVGKKAQTFTINLDDLVESGDSRFNIPILGGDVISVPRAGIIYVVGAVNRPGGFVIQNDRDRMTALKILSLAGGPTGSAKTKAAVILRKNLDTGKRDEVPLDLNKVMKLKADDVTLQGSDILFVPDSSGKRALHRAGDVAIGLAAGVAIFGVSKL
jgi:protein involved in polysaccharide export with SLBB domain